MKKITKKQRAPHTNTIAVLTPNELGFAVGGAVSTALGILVPQFEPNRPLGFGILVPQFGPNRPLGFGVILHD